MSAFFDWIDTVETGSMRDRSMDIILGAETTWKREQHASALFILRKAWLSALSFIRKRDADTEKQGGI